MSACVCHVALTRRQVALWQGVGDVGQLAAVVAVLQGADVHVAPLLQLLQPAALLLALAVRVQHHAHPQGTCGEWEGQRGETFRILKLNFQLITVKLY